MTRKNLSIFGRHGEAIVCSVKKMEINTSLVVTLVILAVVIFLVWRQESLTAQVTVIEQLVNSIHPSQTSARNQMRNSVWNDVFPLPPSKEQENVAAATTTFIDTKNRVEDSTKQ